MNEKIYEKELIFYSTLYKLLGVIELTLRHRIPNTLSVIARKPTQQGELSRDLRRTSQS